ncbi:MAG: iron-sulfur cluster assembly accessory protein [Myxococcota bacterium]
MALLAIQRKGQQHTKKSASSKMQAQSIAADKLHMTQRAAQQIVQQAANKQLLLRVAVEGGGCGGFRCRFSWESSPRHDDCLMQQDQAAVCVDPKSMQILGGSTLDWQQELGRSGFQVLPAGRSSSCSCGQSFTLL